jgi:hypothetical protein
MGKRGHSEEEILRVLRSACSLIKAKDGCEVTKRIRHNLRSLVPILATRHTEVIPGSSLQLLVRW